MVDTSSWKVVIIDDEPDNIGVVAFIFDFQNVPMRTANSGETGLALLREEKPTFLLLDLQMPKMTGWEVLKVIREDAQLKELVVIALTAHAMAGDKEKALAVGFDGYITKPISPATFIQTIDEIIQLRIKQ
jgi:two-component system cell cycle response regulator DivK